MGGFVDAAKNKPRYVLIHNTCLVITIGCSGTSGRLACCQNGLYIHSSQSHLPILREWLPVHREEDSQQLVQATVIFSLRLHIQDSDDRGGTKRIERGVCVALACRHELWRDINATFYTHRSISRRQLHKVGLRTMVTRNVFYVVYTNLEASSENPKY